MACAYCGCTSGHHRHGCPLQEAEQYGHKRCQVCGEYILVGETGYEIGDAAYHYDCLDQCDTDELVRLLTGAQTVEFGEGET